MDSRRAHEGWWSRLLFVSVVSALWLGLALGMAALGHALVAPPPIPAVAPVSTGAVLPNLPGFLGGTAGLESAAQQRADAANPRNFLFTDDHRVFTQVGYYGDCTGRAPLTRAAAAIDTCVGGLDYFIGHNPGVFTGLMQLDVGSSIQYYDPTGHLYTLQVVAVRTWLRKDGVPPPVLTGEAAEFQTCVTPDGSVDRILDVVVA